MSMAAPMFRPPFESAKPFVPAAPAATANTSTSAGSSPAKQSESSPVKAVFVPVPRARVAIRITNPETGDVVEIKKDEPNPTSSASTSPEKKKEEVMAEEGKDQEVTAESEAVIAADIAADETPKKSVKTVESSPARVQSPERKPSPARTPSPERITQPIAASTPVKTPEPRAAKEPTPKEVKVVSTPRQADSPAKVAESTPSASPEKVAAVTPSASPASKSIMSRAPSPSRSERSHVSESTEQTPANVDTATSEKPRIRYTSEFLLSFRSRCTEKPADLSNMEAVIGGDDSQGYGSRRGSAKNGRASDMGLPPRGSRMSDSGRHTDIMPSSGARSMAAASFRSASGPRAPPGFGGKPSRDRDRDRGSTGGRRSSGRGSRSEPPPMPEGEPVAPLIKSENRWIPGQKAISDQAEAALRAARSLLNKLTIEKFDRIASKMAALDIADKQSMCGIIDLIMDKACDEPKFCDMYARLASRLCTELSDFSDGMFSGIVIGLT
jgi:translation initiation factor 4G